MIVEHSYYGIIANVLETDRIFRNGAKVWFVGILNERSRWFGLSRGGRKVEKYAPLHRFHNFRAAWVPVHMLDRVCWRGSQGEAVIQAAKLNTLADAERAAHPNRRSQI